MFLNRFKTKPAGTRLPGPPVSAPRHAAPLSHSLPHPRRCPPGPVVTRSSLSAALTPSHPRPAAHPCRAALAPPTPTSQGPMSVARAVLRYAQAPPLSLVPSLHAVPTPDPPFSSPLDVEPPDTPSPPFFSSPAGHRDAARAHPCFSFSSVPKAADGRAWSRPALPPQLWHWSLPFVGSRGR
jgi:hypothetical protein